MRRSGFWFLVVGCGAALTHMAVFTLIGHVTWPELANAVGFAVGFCVSFSGHRWLSFSDASTTIRQSLLRFGVTALAGFASNELVFVALLRGLAWPALAALLAAMVVAAGQTFVLGRYWAFRA